jgi:hypothetical protein
MFWPSPFLVCPADREFDPPAVSYLLSYSVGKLDTK